MLEDVKLELTKIKKCISIIFEIIEKNKLQKGNKDGDESERIKKYILTSQAICQYLKILSSLTKGKYNICIKEN